jgi:hypothetical protein
MPDYTCTTATCPSGGAPIVLNTANQTYCPQCFNNTLQPYVRPRIEQMMNAGGQMSAANPGMAAECEQLIQLFSITLVSSDEARTPRDCIVKLGSDRRKRIDRQGPISNAGTITHARYAVQLSSPVYAGIHMPVDTNFTIAHVRNAFRRSLQQGQYVRIFWG